VPSCPVVNGILAQESMARRNCSARNGFAVATRTRHRRYPLLRTSADRWTPEGLEWLVIPAAFTAPYPPAPEHDWVAPVSAVAPEHFAFAADYSTHLTIDTDLVARAWINSGIAGFHSD
jgi:hypothetical protein